MEEQNKEQSKENKVPRIFSALGLGANDVLKTIEQQKASQAPQIGAVNPAVVTAPESVAPQAPMAAPMSDLMLSYIGMTPEEKQKVNNYLAMIGGK